MPIIKYVLHPGYVISNTDNERHYIGTFQLLKLYGLAENIDYMVYDPTIHPFDYDTNTYKYIHLYPKADGKYEIQL